MNDKQTKILIIDASVARAAGNIEAVKPVPRLCRDFLSAAFDICHKVGMTDGIEREWNKHASGFTMHWLTMMVSHGKRKRISSRKNTDLRRKISSSGLDSESRKAMLKDVILIEAAMVSDGIVVSLDEKARGLFQGFSDKAVKLNNIYWINPSANSETPIKWLDEGAQLEEKRSLGYKRKGKLTVRRRREIKRV